MNKIDYKSAGVDIDAGNEAIEKIKDGVKSTFSKNVLTGLGSFGSLYDLKPLLEATKQIDYFIKKYPETDYSIDLQFKKKLIQNQLAAKEMYNAKYYTSVQKWAPAINRLKIIVNKYDETIFIEEALHRLVEIHYYLGLDEEAKRYAKILGYNYNSSEWYKQSYKIINKDYDYNDKINEGKKKENEIIKNKV